MNAKSTAAADLDSYLAARESERALITAERHAELMRLAGYLRGRIDAGETARLLFVCTHNSRRSQLAQLWAAAAGDRYGVPVETYSAGTESTAFHPRAVAAVERAGFLVERQDESDNPIYLVRMRSTETPVACSSKLVDTALLPGQLFAAVMVCNAADAACPFVAGAELRMPLTYVDPKVSDGTPDEAATYDERCAQIARQMLCLVDLVRAEA